MDASLHPSGSTLALRHGSGPAQAGATDVQGDGSGRASVRLILPSAGVAIYG